MPHTKIRNQFGKELMALCEKYECSTIFFAALIQGVHGVCLAKIEKDVVNSIAAFSLLIANVPDIYQFHQQIAFQTYLDKYNELKQNPQEGGDLLSEFKVEGKFKH